jgi:hypothetical protein
LASRKPKVAWEALSDDDLLHLRICDLKVQINGTTVDVGPDTEVRLPHPDPAHPGRSWIQLILGRIRSLVVGDRDFVVGTEAAAAAAQGTIFALEVRADQTTVLTVGEGSIELKNWFKSRSFSLMVCECFESVVTMPGEEERIR